MVQAGVGYTTDMNGFRQEGIGPMDMTIHNGTRFSASRAYLWPVGFRIFFQSFLKFADIKSTESIHIQRNYGNKIVVR